MMAAKRKYDRLLAPAGRSPEEMAVDHAVAPFDEAARASEREWGIDVLVTLVSPETAAKFGRQIGKLNAAMDANDVPLVASLAAGAVRGLAAMDAEARAAGHTPKAAPVEIVELDDWRCGILLDERHWKRATDEHPGLPLFSLREAAVALQSISAPIVAAVKREFAGAEVVAIRKANQPMMDEEIPFP